MQTPHQTLDKKSGSCRDMANLLMAAVKNLGLAARFVGGYIFSNEENDQSGSTHAWTEVFIPGAGWKGFDPTFGTIVGAEHIAVAVSRQPELIPPISGSFYGAPDSTMAVNVRVTELS